MIVLKTNELCKKYGNHLVVKNVNLRINEGDIYGFVGENGAGKTTVIRLVSGLIKATSGEYTLFEGKALPVGSIGAIVENPSVYPYLTAVENVKQQYMLLGRTDYSSINDLLLKVGLGDVINSPKKASNFSLGMKQRLGIALILVGEPKLLILDEPMNGLDPEGIVEMRNLIIRLNREHNITFLISSHLLDELSKVVTRYGFIHHGELVKEISATEVESLGRKRWALKLNTTSGIEKTLKSKIKEFEVLSENDLVIYDDLKAKDIIQLLSNAEFEVNEINSMTDGIETFYLNLIGRNK